MRKYLTDHIGFNKSRKSIPKSSMYLVFHGHRGQYHLGVISSDDLNKFISKLKKDEIEDIKKHENSKAIKKYDSHIFWNGNELRREYKIEYFDSAEEEPEGYWTNKTDHWCLDNHVIARFEPIKNL